MPQIDLRQFVVASYGTWTEPDRLAATFQPHRLRLDWDQDTVTLSGPLRLRITFFASNRTEQPQGKPVFHKHRVYSYGFEIPPAHTWSYQLRQDRTLLGILGNNATYGVHIEPAGPERDVPVLDGRGDVPCDFAVADLPHAGTFFPSACDPCPPGAPVGLPPGKPGLAVPPAAGGCRRPRFFNGMFMTSQDLESFLRWSQVKNQLQNRAMGAGVVWGLDVCRDGDALLVTPGYAVDCCGHDLTITTPYRVVIQDLLRDPEAAPLLGQRGAQCLHLLLEYVECPEEPRPVHGDPCAPDVARCEMSRVRETVRLRLVPPRHFQPQSPVGDFLKELEKLRKEFDLPGLASAAAKTAKGSASEPSELNAPFQFTLFLHVSPDKEVQSTIQPSTEKVVQVPLDSIDIDYSSMARFQLEAHDDHLLFGGRVLDSAGKTVAEVDVPQPRLEWEIDLEDFATSTEETFPVAVTFTVEDLRIGELFGDAQAPHVTTTTQLTFEGTLIRAAEVLFYLVEASLRTPAVELVAQVPQPAPWPCGNDPCCPDTPLFPVFPPFLHRDPLQPDDAPAFLQAADWKVLTLAIVYGWLASENARHRVGTQQQVQSGRLLLARTIYRVALFVLFRSRDSANQRHLTEALQRLLRTWCQSFLYPGPRCEDKPDGVVIGCVRAEAGDLSTVDPWGGRRYVVHEPLLDHWRTQVGIVPRDVMVSRVLSLVCCTANLPVPDLDRGGFGGPVDTIPQGALGVPLGSSFLNLRTAEGGKGDPAAEFDVVRSEDISFSSFLSRAVGGLREPPSAPGARYVRYRVAGVPIELLAPVPPVATPSPSPDGEKRRVLVRKVQEMAGKARTAVPPLLENFTQELTADLLGVTPLANLEDNPLQERLTAAGVSTAAKFFSHSLADLHEKVVQRADPRALLALAQANEERATAVSRATRALVGSFSSSHDIVAPEELVEEKRLTLLADASAKEFKKRHKAVPISEDLVRAVVRSTVRRSTVRRSTVRRNTATGG